MKKYILDLRVKSNERLNNQNVLLKLSADIPLPEVLPGQFAEIRVDGSPPTFLRRPISVNYVDYQLNEVWFLVQEVGEGTKKLAEAKISQLINVIFPLGNSFSNPETPQQRMLLVGGGVGVAPLLYLGSELKKKGLSPEFLLGGKRAEDILQLHDFRKYGNVYITTEDGSLGEKGFVTNHSVLSTPKFDRIYTCGPTPMMKAVAGYAARNGIYCEVSLENTMACGIGACLCCVTDTVNGHLCVCTDGPVFNSTILKWEI